jgi:LuxR family maltose regulon positive regulatory protein
MSTTLTPAELRLLPVLSTPLTFREIGERLYLSPHTIKTQAISIYGKLEASSRSEAVERAIELGLLEPFPTLAPRPTRASD